MVLKVENRGEKRHPLLRHTVRKRLIPHLHQGKCTNAGCVASHLEALGIHTSGESSTVLMLQVRYRWRSGLLIAISN